MDAITTKNAVSTAVRNTRPLADNTNNASTTTNNAASSNVRDAQIQSTAAGQPAAQQTDRQDRIREQQRQSRQLENVVSRSEDGDTVQVSPTTEERLARASEGAVMRREDAARAREEARAAEEARRALQEAAAQARRQRLEESRQQAEDSTQSEQITNFAGYTSSQIETLYAQGRISRQDYESELAKRQERTDNTIASNDRTARQLARLNGTRTQTQMTADAIKTAFADNASNPREAAMRLDAMQRVTETQRQQTEINKNNEGRRTWDYQLQA